MASKDIVVKHNKLSSERIPTVFFFFPVVAVTTTAKPYDLETCMYGLTERRGLRSPFLLSSIACTREREKMKKRPKIGVGSRLFLTAAPNLQIGTRLPSGHWREKVYSQLIEKVDPYDSMEFIWEIVRLREFPHLPSRIDSRFLWDNEDAARWWHHRRHIMNFMDSPRGYEQRHGDPNLTGLYEVEVVECSRVFAANIAETCWQKSVKAFRRRLTQK